MFRNSVPLNFEGVRRRNSVLGLRRYAGTAGSVGSRALRNTASCRRTRAARVLLRSEGSHRHVSVDAFVDALAAAETSGWSAGREKTSQLQRLLSRPCSTRFG